MVNQTSKKELGRRLWIVSESKRIVQEKMSNEFSGTPEHQALVDQDTALADLYRMLMHEIFYNLDGDDMKQYAEMDDCILAETQFLEECDHTSIVSVSETECQCMDCLRIWNKEVDFRSDWPECDRG